MTCSIEHLSMHDSTFVNPVYYLITIYSDKSEVFCYPCEHFKICIYEANIPLIFTVNFTPFFFKLRFITPIFQDSEISHL
jgi:hypothetical protein